MFVNFAYQKTEEGILPGLSESVPALAHHKGIGNPANTSETRVNSLGLANTLSYCRCVNDLSVLGTHR